MAVTMENIADFMQRFRFDQTQSLDSLGGASIYLGEDVVSGEKVAIRCIESHKLVDQTTIIGGYKRSFSLQHPNLLSYQHVYSFEDGDAITHFVIMPHVPNQHLTLHHVQSWNIEQKKAFFLRVVKALKYLHEQGFVAQTLHPTHLLLGIENQPLLVNYTHESKRALSFFTSYETLAPEQLDENTAIGTFTDVWALGALLYWLFAGRFPFGNKVARGGRNVNAKIRQRILKGDLPEHLEEVPQPYKTIIEQCLNVAPEERWDSVEPILLALESSELSEKVDVLQEDRNTGTISPSKRDKQTINSTKEATSQPFRSFKRKPSPPISWGKAIIWLALAGILGYLLGQMG